MNTIAVEHFADQNIDYWSKRAPSYSVVNQEEIEQGRADVWGAVIEAEIAARFPGRAPASIRVLDIGTGPGFFAILLAQRGYPVSAIDYTAAMLDEARHNAGPWAAQIDFARMDAEALAFESAGFDVIVTRNLTWNLLRPDTAYAEWHRVLKPGGLLLNFDANWYRYLYDDAARDGYDQDRQNIVQAGVGNETAGTDIPAMEAIALQNPLSAQVRPAWDAGVLGGLGMRVQCDEAVWQRVWTHEEKINNASTPMFLVRAEKA